MSVTIEWRVGGGIYQFFSEVDILKCEHSGNRKGNEKLKTQHRLENGVVN